MKPILQRTVDLLLEVNIWVLFALSVLGAVLFSVVLGLILNALFYDGTNNLLMLGAVVIPAIDAPVFIILLVIVIGELRRSRHELDLRVKDRTKQLEETNRRLVTEIEHGRVLLSQRDEIQQQLQQSQKMETVGRLAGGIAHDFNNLVTIINSYAEFADEGLREGDPLKSDLQQIKDAGKRAADLTRQLLAFSRKQVLEPQALDLSAVVSGLETMLRRLVGEDIELRTMLDRQLGMVNADPGQIEQVLMNLVVNARDAMPLGGQLIIETKDVELDADYASHHADTVAGPYVMLAVTDSGEGMTQTVRDRVFEPFFTTKEKGRGTGLGLATVYGIIKQSGGNIWVYSEPGRGTTFKIFLPRVERESTRPSVVPKDTIDLRGSETVLVVEDEPAVRELTRRILESAGYRPIVAANGSEALLECEGHEAKVRLLLTDVVMPKMSGKELAERLEKLSPGLRVLYMSGYTDNAIVHHGMLDAGTHFIAKPFDAASLLKKVRQVLDMSADSTDAPSQNREGPG